MDIVSGLIGVVVGQDAVSEIGAVEVVLLVIVIILSAVIFRMHQQTLRLEAQLRVMREAVEAAKTRVGSASEQTQAESTQTAGTIDPRGQIMFEQHRRLNDLQIAKLSAELELLKRQIDRKGEEADRLEAGKEVHELMVEKTRLEIDSLRLHLVELRKRAEDWGSEG